MSISAISKNQWFKILKVAFWVALSTVVSAIPAFLTSHVQWLAAAPGVNLVIYAVSMLFQNEVATSESASGLPMNGVNQLTQPPVTNEAGQPVTDPNAAR